MIPLERGSLRAMSVTPNANIWESIYLCTSVVLSKPVNGNESVVTFLQKSSSSGGVGKQEPDNGHKNQAEATHEEEDTLVSPDLV